MFFWKPHTAYGDVFNQTSYQNDETESPSLVTKTGLARKESTKAFLCFYKDSSFQLTQLLGFHKIRKRAL